VADNEQDNAREHLTEREREIIKQLASEIVREAGIKRDPEEEARRERVKSYAESLRHANTVSGATAVGAAILYTNLDLQFNGLVLAALISIGVSFVVTTGGTYLCAGKEPPISNYFLGLLESSQWLSFVLLFLAVWFFAGGAMV
jgi:hypothetical protein